MLQHNVKTRLLSFVLMIAMLFSMVGALPSMVAQAAEDTAYVEVKLGDTVLTLEKQTDEDGFDAVYKAVVPAGTTELEDLSITEANPDPNASPQAFDVDISDKDGNRVWFLSNVQMGKDNYLQLTVSFDDYETEMLYKLYFEAEDSGEEPAEPEDKPYVEVKLGDTVLTLEKQTDEDGFDAVYKAVVPAGTTELEDLSITEANPDPNASPQAFDVDISDKDGNRVWFLSNVQMGKDNYLQLTVSFDDYETEMTYKLYFEAEDSGEEPTEPEGYIGTKTEAKVYDDFENDIWLQFQHKSLQVGETLELYPRRTPQIISNSVANDVQRPNFHFEVIRGKNVIGLSTDESTDKTVIEAKAQGTAVVKVTYDALTYNGQTWGAISDVNTGYAVITVGEDGAATIDSSLEDWRHYDTIYYNEGETTPYTFTVNTENAESVKVTCNGIEVQGDNGSYTANLENRSNIIGIVATDKDGKTTSLYRMVDARFMEVVVANKTNEDQPLQAGDTANISFKGITMPVYKLATIYNPQFGSNATAVVYKNDTLGSFKGKCSQWDLATNNDFDVTFSESGNYTFTSDGENGKGIWCAWWGDALGSDLLKGEPGEPNLNAPTYSDYFSTMPSFTVSVGAGAAVPAEKIELNTTDDYTEVGDTLQLTATVTPADATDTVVWSSSDESIATVDENGLVTGVDVGEVTITATAGEVSASCHVQINMPSSVVSVRNAIRRLPAAEDITLDYEYDVEAAREKYNDLEEAYKVYVGEEYVSKLEAAEQKIADLKAVQSVEEAIAALKAPEELTLEGKDAVQAAQAAYDALTDSQKALVSEEAKAALDAAQAKIAELEDQAQKPDPEPTPDPTPTPTPDDNTGDGNNTTGNTTTDGNSTTGTTNNNQTTGTTTQTSSASGNANTGIVADANVLLGAAALMAVAALGAVAVFRRRKQD
ncbi:MAG: Ig-like domain-containing protein [Eubacterium sp.]|nr:Ig-like domain-containing protein [Eubacterium sp.]